MKASAFVYPWDVNGDPEAPARIAALGTAQVTLASAYHSTRALTPRHPRHRVVTAEHAAVLYPVGDGWTDQALRPVPAGDWAPGDAFGEAAAALADAGLEVHTWVVLAHSSRLGWYGLAHLHAHDKTAGVALGDAGQYLMSLCFCASCREGYGTRGLDAGELAAAVRAALEPVWRGAPSDGGWAGVGKLLGEETAEATRAWRDETARTLQEAAVAAVRRAAPEGFQVLLHADPVSYHCGANAGVDPAHILSVADGVVVPCTGDAGLLTPFAGEAREDTVLAANFTVVSGMGGSPGTLAADADRARRLGATELRLYHAGLASDGDLAAVRTALAGL